MQNKEVDQRLVDDLIHHYTEKKRLTNKNFRYISTVKDDAYLREAGSLCVANHLDASTYVQMMYDRMGEHKALFSPKHMQGTKVKHMLAERETSESNSTQVEINNANLAPADMWAFQHKLAMMYIRRGDTVESVLLDSSLKFFAWYRILATPNRVPEIIDKYKHIAKKEMTPRLNAFCKSENLDLERIL